jgi:hypothetical protein
MQSSGLGTVTRKTSISRTSFGQNSAQMLHPLQLRSITSILAPLIPVYLLFWDLCSLKQRKIAANLAQNMRQFYTLFCFFRAITVIN